MLIFIRRSKQPRKSWFRCMCGEEFTAYDYNVSSGHTQSCGCLRRETTRARATTHGHKSNGERSKAYVAWVNMKQRCRNQKREDFSDYGARGIGYDPAWENFQAFLSDMGEPQRGQTLERLDNNRSYSKDNCAWVGRSVQSLNRRNVKRFEFDGKNLTLGEWSLKTGIGRITLLKRIQSGMSLEQALTTPVGKAHVMAAKKAETH